MFDKKSHRAGEFTADRQSLQEPEASQQDGRRYTNGGERRQEANKTGWECHEEDRTRQCLASSQGIPPIAKEQCPERTSKKPYREDAEGRSEKLNDIQKGRTRR